MELTNGEENGSDQDTTQTKGKKRRNPFNTQKMKEEKERRQKKRARLIVRNISYKVTEDVFRKHFEQWGTVVDLNILKRADGKLVGCAFVQYDTINQATKAILKSNGKDFLGRPIYVDWALGKDEFQSKTAKDEPTEKKPKVEVKDEESDGGDDEEIKEESDEENEGSEDEEEDVEAEGSEVEGDEDDDEEGEDDDEQGEDDDEEGEDDEGEDADEDGDAGSDDGDDDDDKKDKKLKKAIGSVKPEKHISNDVQEGCTVFIKNVSFDAEDDDLRKVCRKYGPVYYAIINRDRISGHSKGTAFVKFKSKESADMCLQAGTDFVLMEQVLDPHPALSREEIKQQADKKAKGEEAKDSRNLYLAREGLIMTGSKAAEGVSASDMQKRHKLEQVKTQMLKNLNRFISRNRLSIHNLPVSYDNDKLKDMIIRNTGLKPHECRVMRENQITAEHPQGKSKGFGFMSFNTHQDALNALRKLNNNPKVFTSQHRPIVAFSIEDKAVHRIKENRKEKSKLSNPTFKEKLSKRQEARKEKQQQHKLKPLPKGPQSDDKAKLREHIKKLEAQRAKAKEKKNKPKGEQAAAADEFVGAEAEPGTMLRMRSMKKLREQASEHMKKVKQDKRKLKQKKIRESQLAEKRDDVRPKQGRKVERDDLTHLVNKYKRMLDTGSEAKAPATTASAPKVKKPKRQKWYQE